MATFTGHRPTPAEASETDRSGLRWRMIVKRALQFSFLFFLLKGLAWLAVGFLAWQGLT
jgi:hypothetical protein